MISDTGVFKAWNPKQNLAVTDANAPGHPEEGIPVEAESWDLN